MIISRTRRATTSAISSPNGRKPFLRPHEKQKEPRRDQSTTANGHEWSIAERLGRSRFGVYLANLANFASSRVVPKRAKTSDSRERPIGSQLYIVTNRKPWVNASRWVIRRSRPLQPSLVGRSAETKYGQ